MTATLAKWAIANGLINAGGVFGAYAGTTGLAAVAGPVGVVAGIGFALATMAVTPSCPVTVNHVHRGGGDVNGK